MGWKKKSNGDFRTYKKNYTELVELVDLVF
jgi:hypothetical protein